jgi:hypothetical protein
MRPLAPFSPVPCASPFSVPSRGSSSAKPSCASPPPLSPLACLLRPAPCCAAESAQEFGAEMARSDPSPRRTASSCAVEEGGSRALAREEPVKDGADSMRDERGGGRYGAKESSLRARERDRGEGVRGRGRNGTRRAAPILRTASPTRASGGLRPPLSRVGGVAQRVGFDAARGTRGTRCRYPAPRRALLFDLAARLALRAKSKSKAQKMGL